MDAWDQAKLIERLRVAENEAYYVKVTREENERLKAYQRDIEEREGACCPEDVGFDEYIKRLERKNERLKKRVGELEVSLVYTAQFVDNFTVKEMARVTAKGVKP